MPKIKTIQTNFTAGEISPKCFGRLDVARYQNGAESLENCLIDIQGAANRRMATQFIKATKDSTRRTILVPFVFSTTQAYMLELGHNYLRVYVAGGGQITVGGVPFELVTPWSESMLADLDYTQGADTMFLFHPDVTTYTLRRLAADSWTLQPAPFVVRPFDEIGHRFATGITLSSASVGAGRTVTAGAAVFFNTDVGRTITTVGSGRAVVTAFNSSTSVTVEIQEAFGSTSIAANAWVLEGTPQGALAPSAKDPVGATVQLTFALSLDGWRPEDVGKFVSINGGLVQITSYDHSGAVTGVIKRGLTATIEAPADAWVLEASVWNAQDGYPRTGAFYEQRLAAAGSRRFPQAVWGSRSGLYYDFTQGTDDDDGFTFKLPSTGQINPILRLVGATVLLPLTFGGEFTMHGGIEKPLTPTNVQTKGRSVYGCSNVKPVRIGGEIIFVQRARRKIRALSYDPDSMSYRAPELTVLADHITKSGIVGMAYQQEPASQDMELQEPASLLWCVRADGKMATLTLDRDEGVVAWAPQSTDGSFEAVASVPRPDGGDEVWVIVRRTVDGAERRYVERFEDGFYMDSAIRGTNPGGSSVWGNLDHLEGKTVWCLADGVYIGEFIVTAGEITITRDAKVVEIGLPMINRVTLLRPEAQLGDGTAQSSMISTSRVLPLVRDTIGCKVDTGDGHPEDIPFRAFGDELLDRPPALFSGYKSVGTLGWHQSDSPLTLIQDKPYPFHLLAVVREITFNS